MTEREGRSIDMEAKYLLVLALLLACSKSAPDKTPDKSDDAEKEPEDPNLARLSFFVTSLQSLRELSGSQSGFGGNLRFGETGEGAGSIAKGG
jgi:hypothetical protein